MAKKYQERPLIAEGTKFGKLTVLSPVGKKTHRGSILYRCVCECGKERTVSGERLFSGSAFSCGCLSKNPTHAVWSSMKARCSNPDHKAYKDYGGRGITFCDRWKKFSNFLQDMGEAPDGLTLDRIDVNGNYEPDNCHWTDWNYQNRNRRNNKLTPEIVEIIRTSSKRHSSLAKELGVCPETISRVRQRILWPDKESVILPLYDFVCPECKERIELLVRKTDETIVCPKCNKALMKQVWSTPAPAQWSCSRGSL